MSGYFLGGTPILNGEFVAVDTARILDTRNNININGKVAAKAVIASQMLGRNGVPLTNVSAVVLNVTVDHTIGLGYITVFPNAGPRTITSNLNFVAGSPRPNAVITQVGTDGRSGCTTGPPGQWI